MARKKTLGNQLASGTKNVASFFLMPPPGSRKTSITVLIVLPFFFIATLALFWFHVPVIEWINSIGDILYKMLMIYVGGNALENGASIVANRNGKPNGNGNGQQEPPKPKPPVPSPFLKKENQQGGPPVAPAP